MKTKKEPVPGFRIEKNKKFSQPNQQKTKEMF